MSHAGNVCRALAVCVMTLGAAIPAVAQNLPAAEISAGYQGFDSSDLNGFSGAQGWYGEGAYNWNRLLAIVGQVGAGYNTEDNGVTNGITVAPQQNDVSSYQFLAGVRASARPGARTAVFGQVLAGAVRLSGSGTPGVSTGPAGSVDTSQTQFGLQFGVGVNLAAMPRLGVRLGLDALRTYDPGADAAAPFGYTQHTNALRFTAGVVIPIGGQ